ncbi:GDYXXLXY domain-containing protein [Acinetobacter shaoyimingii]|uniref:GDYXXLXY domain-containing protein n=1 Tax=Acinetobacter shaoyimingii TaxID=2715164 RepID=A0A6G8RZZ5_9GAMM|nr:GDYXXLXY domain-containing protein [Acinetobacter shaoyimingii]QIO07434.1 GDYXXLXY domain-containing protein [Acinetobacter shaoyimingii]
MKKIFPLALAFCSVLIFVGLVIKHELHLRQAQSIYVQLQPVDPRSLLQGDYMVLNYDLKLHEVNDQQIENQSQIMSYVLLDERHRVIKTTFDLESTTFGTPQSIPLILKNPKNYLDALYPAANSFLFAEGLEPCYRDAKYAEIKVKPNGQALLVGLVDQYLKSLNCEQQKKWAEGSGA